MLAANELDALVTFAVRTSQSERTRAPRWTPEEDDFVRQNLGWLTDEEMGKALGRTAVAVHLHWDRDMGLPGPSKAPDVLTANEAADILGLDVHATAFWIDAGLIPGRRMAGTAGIRLIRRRDFRRWVLNPMNWPYFHAERVTDPELHRMLAKRAARWGDEWWTTRQAADHHGVDPKDVLRYIKLGRLQSFQPPVSIGGRYENRKWAFHFVLKSEVMRVTFVRGKGGAKKISRRFTPAADAWILKARDQLGMTFTEIGRTMKIGKAAYHHRTNPIIMYRYHWLKNQAAKKKRS